MCHCRMLILSIVSLLSVPSVASDYDLNYMSLNFENDVFYREDNGYSNGVALKWGYYDVGYLDQNNLPRWIAYLAENSYLNTLPDRQYDIHYTFGQFLQTANDLSTSSLIEDDAPYVGLLAWQVSALAANEYIADELNLTLGLVGPAAKAEYVQTHLHDWISATEPEGWDNQIDNEFVFKIQAQRLWRNYTFQLPITEMDFITGVNAGVGNLGSDINVGMGLRWGQSLAANFASSSPFIVQKLNGLKASPYGWYAFANLSAGYVFNDIFIDGNTFHNSHHVELINWQAGMAIGAQVNLYNWNFLYSMIYTTDQYEDQSDEVRWGNITITYHF